MIEVEFEIKTLKFQYAEYTGKSNTMEVGCKELKFNYASHMGRSKGKKYTKAVTEW